MTPTADQSARRKYSFVRHLAEGGMGSVDLVVRVEGTFVRFHALKRLRPELRADIEIRKMFLREAEIAGLLNHPNVVSVVDVGHDGDGPYLVMDFVQGVPLSALIRAARARNVQVPLQVVLRILGQVATGLHAAHELIGSDGTALDLVHRDVSPQNILVGYDGIARLTDFGIAKAQLFGADRTSTGLLKGKLGYLAPEQLRFERATRRTDLFSLGVVMYEALSARRLYGGGELEDVARRILLEPPPDLYDTRPDAHPALVELLFDLLAKTAGDRPATAQDVAEKLDALLADALVAEPPISVAEFVGELFAIERDEQRRALADITVHTDLTKLDGTRSRWRTWAVIAAAVSAIAIGGTSAWLWSHGAHTATTPTARPAARTPALVNAVPLVRSEPVVAEAPEVDDVAPATSEGSRSRHRPRRRAQPVTAQPASHHSDELVGWERH